MGFSQIPETFTILDSRGITRVEVDANGQRKETPMTREEYDKLNPKHQDSNCTECKFVQDSETLLAGMVPAEKRNAAGDQPEFIGKFTMPNWTGHSSFYLFRCRNCKEVVVDYPHGYMYLRCINCRTEILLNKRKYKEFYVRDNLHIPAWSLKNLVESVKLKLKKINFLQPEPENKSLHIEDLEKLKLPSGREASCRSELES